jgi:hypothetical protein
VTKPAAQTTQEPRPAWPAVIVTSLGFWTVIRSVVQGARARHTAQPEGARRPGQKQVYYLGITRNNPKTTIAA